jgi:hypothetical protein
MAVTPADLEAVVRNRICSVCSDRKTDGTCGLREPADCALFRLFPQVTKAIQSIRSEHVEDYTQAIRRHVCSVCMDQDAKGDCAVRREVRVPWMHICCWW